MSEEKMTFRDYETAAMETSQWNETPPMDKQALAYGVMAVAGEAGELANLIKKLVYHGEYVDAQRVVEEAGDVLWHLTDFCASFGISLETVAERNLDKLAARWPEGFKHGDRQSTEALSSRQQLEGVRDAVRLQAAPIGLQKCAARGAE